MKKTGEVMSQNRSKYFFLILLSVFSLLGCNTTPRVRTGTALASDRTSVSEGQAARDRVESLLVMGSPSSIQEALELSSDSSVLGREESRVYTWIAYEMGRLVYPELIGSDFSVSGTAPDGPLVKAFVDARNGRSLESGSSPLYEMLPVLGLFRIKTSQIAGTVLAASERFSAWGMDSALVMLARGMALERTGNKNAAIEAYTASLKASDDCYPASLALSVLLSDNNRSAEAIAALRDLPPIIKETHAFKRSWAIALYSSGLWTEALPLVSSALVKDPMDSKLMFIRAHILVEQKDYKQAAPLMDALAAIDPWDKNYLYLKARVAMEQTKDRGTALSALRKGLERNPDDSRLLVYASELLWTGNSAEKNEAVILAGKAIAQNPKNEKAARILLYADIDTGNIENIASRLDSILGSNPDFSDYSLLYRASMAVGRLDDAARTVNIWLLKDPELEEANLALLEIYIEKNERAKANELLNRLLLVKGSSQFRSKLFYQQSRLQTNDDTALAMLRSALIENGMNLDALVASYDIYYRKGDYQRAQFYLKQALGIAPNRPELISRKNALAQQGVAIP